MDIKSGTSTGGLSNFAPREFTFRGVRCCSMEGLLQSFKFKDPDVQKQVCTLVGLKAKRRGQKKRWFETQTLWWNGNPIKRDSQEYQDLLHEAFEALFRGNAKARKALLDTGYAVLTHSIGRRKINETILTRREFCSLLMSIRSRIRAEEFVDF